MFYFNLISVISACVFDRKRRKETIYSTVRVSVTRVLLQSHQTVLLPRIGPGTNAFPLSTSSKPYRYVETLCRETWNLSVIVVLNLAGFLFMQVRIVN